MSIFFWGLFLVSILAIGFGFYRKFDFPHIALTLLFWLNLYILLFALSQKWPLLLLFFSGCLLLLLLYLPRQRVGHLSRSETFYGLFTTLAIFMLALSILLIPFFPFIFALLLGQGFLIYHINRQNPPKDLPIKKGKTAFVSLRQVFGYHFLKFSPLSTSLYDICLIGDRLFDFSDLLLAKQKAHVTVLHGYGHTKMILPANLPVCFHIHGLRCRLLWQGMEYSLNNERKSFHQPQAEEDALVEIDIFMAVGEIEVVWL